MIKKPAEKTNEKQSVQAKQVNESGLNGTATIEDNRPRTVHQRQLLSTMDAYAAAKTAPIQRHGEEDAVNYVRNLEIRRGNRRQSIRGTNNQSAEKVELLRDFMEEIRKMLKNASRPKEEIIFFKAKIAEELKAGNCDEFSSLIFTHLVENTQGQWVYKAELKKPLDHAFVITSKEEVNDVEEFKTEPTVVDAWDGYKIMSLAQFLDEGNFLGERLTYKDIGILHKEKADNTESLPPGKEVLIEHFNNFKEEFVLPKDWLVEAYDIDGSNIREVNDLRGSDNYKRKGYTYKFDIQIIPKKRNSNQ